MYPSKNFQTFTLENTYLSMEKALEFVGDSSTYQKRVIYIFSLQWTIFCFILMGLPFLFQSPEFVCNGQICPEFHGCDFKPPIVDKERSDSSIALDFNLYCDRRVLVGIAGSLFFLGTLFGGLLFTSISEKKGRKLGLLVSVVLAGTSLTLIGFANNLWFIYICLFATGMAYNGFETTSVIYINEISGERFRNFASLTLTVVWAFGQVIYAALNYFIGDWRAICVITMGFPFFLSFIYMQKQLFETPKFIMLQNKYIEARMILNNIAVINKRPKFTYKLEGEIEEYAFTKGNEPTPLTFDKDMIKIQSENYGFVDLFRYTSLKKTTICLLVLWFFKYFTYFGLTFSVGNYGGEMHENFLLMAIAELVACLMSSGIKSKLTRIKGLMTFVLITMIACVLLIFFSVPSECFPINKSCFQKTVAVFIGMTARFCITVYSSILLSYTGEIYPTVVRNLGFGICIGSGKLGALIIPMVVNSLQNSDWGSFIIFGSFSIVVALLISQMEETYGTNIGDYIQETQVGQKPLLSFHNNNNEDDKNIALLS